MNISADSLLTMVSNNQYSYRYTKRNTVYKIDSKARETCDEAADLRKSIKKLTKYDRYSSTKEMVQKQLEKFTSEYNALQKKEGKIEDKNFQKSFDSLKALVEDNKYKLKKIGFQYDESDKVYRFDEETFQKASAKELENVFSKDNSFMVSADKLVKKLQRIADDKSHVIQHQKKKEVIQLDQTQVLAGYASANTVTILSNLQSLVNMHDWSAEQSGLINQNLDAFATQFNALLMTDANSQESGLVEDYIKLCGEHEEALQEIGIHAATDENGRGILQYTERDWGAASEAEKESLKKLFSGSADSYGVKAEELNKKIFSSAMRLETSGFVVDEYV